MTGSRTGTAILRGGLAAAAGSFLLLYVWAARQPTHFYEGIIVLYALVAACVVVLPATLFLHGLAVFIGRDYLQRLSTVKLLLLSFSFPFALGWMAYAVLRAGFGGVGRWVFFSAPELSLLIGLPALYSFAWVVLLGLLDNPSRRSAARGLLLACGLGVLAIVPAGIADGPRCLFDLKYGVLDMEWIQLPRLARDGRLDPLTRHRAACALADAAVRGKTDMVRNSAVAAIAPFGKAAVRPLARWLREGDAEHKKLACRALGELGPPAADVLLAALDGGDAEIRLSAAAALARTKDPRAVDRLVEVIRAGDAATGRSLAAPLGDLGEPAVPTLIAMLDSPDEGVRSKAGFELMKMRAAAVPYLISALEGAGARKRAGIARTLGELRDRRATAALVALLKDPDKEVRVYAAYGLRAIADPASADALLDVLKDPAPDHDTKCGAVLALSALKDARAAPSLAVLFKTPGHEAHYMREAAVTALGEMAPDETVQLLIDVISDAATDEYVCRDALAAAQRIGDPRLVLPVVGVMQRRPRLQEVAARALGKIGDPRATDALIAALDQPRLSYEMWDLTIAALGKIRGDKAILGLIRLMDEKKNSHCVYRCIEALGKTRDPRAIEPIIRVMAKSTEHGIQGEAWRALYRMTGQEFRTPAEWQTWWETNKESYTPAP